jgi:hypothetical protein
MYLSEGEITFYLDTEKYTYSYWTRYFKADFLHSFLSPLKAFTEKKS